VVLDVDRHMSPGDNLSIAGNNITDGNLVSQFGHTTVDGDTTGLDQSIGFST